MRAYTVHELEALRKAVESKWLFGWYRRPTPKNADGSLKSFAWGTHGYREDEKLKAVEELVRTHMLAGHTADDLVKAEEEARSLDKGFLAR